jgi:NADPH:quinone reductase-like Zn-dependent oxidoreductase
MKAAVYTRYGPPDVVQIREVPKPRPKDHEVRVKILATTVSAGDVRMRSFTVPRLQWLFARLYLGIIKPRRAILGMELAGVVDAVGKGTKRFKVGDQVFASTFYSNFGAHAEYKCLREDGVLALKPTHMSYEEAAPVSGGGLTALLALRTMKIQPGQKVLIYGASGAVGTYAVQLAKHLGAEVTGVCSTANLELVSSLGADSVVDYTQGDFPQGGETYDAILDAVGKLSSAQVRKALDRAGTYLNINRISGKLKSDDLTFLKGIIEQGKMRSVIDRCYRLEEIVEAHSYVDQGHKKGNVVLTP